MSDNPDVIVVGAGGGGAVCAKEIGEQGLKVLVLEAGPWYGNKKWPEPNQERGRTSSSDPNDLDIGLYKKQHNMYENNMNDIVTGLFRWGPADRRRPPWFRSIPQRGFFWQNSGVGGTTQHYWGISVRAFPDAIDSHWPLSYNEMIPYYEKVEATLPVEFAATTTKEELFYYGAKKAGFSLNNTLDVTKPGYRPNVNAILPPNKHLMNPDYSLQQLSRMEGCTLAGFCINGCRVGPTVERIAKRSTLVSYVPLALKTGNVSVRPNAFATKIITEDHHEEGTRAIGLEYRDTWTGRYEECYAKVIVLAGGCAETPRLWLNSGLPRNPWVGKGLTTHYFDWVTGIFDERYLINLIGEPSASPFVGNTSGARLDYPGLGAMHVSGVSPGLTALFTYGFSEAGYHFLNIPGPDKPWDYVGRLVGSDLKQYMASYRQTMSILILTDDQVNMKNGITVNPAIQDEHGPVPVFHYSSTTADEKKRNKLAAIAADILKQAGAKTVIRSDWPPGLAIHAASNMRMGFVVDTSCEAYQVKRLYLADNTVQYNGLGGPNPTLTTQMLATRTADKIVEKYFS
ncbi:Choline dehydrogenase [Evansella caseinilytica]|uniref:Choline dehydrogenase n=1 Tax=Evansella caseinilytica TaxID=1503961 RepID=A0A1H3GP19_9BACI|nr:GMC family oxidoreductase N-terminal domain-containing protein [Evansella caseinilytica]SDY04790.1 Choline dehydrogenase [Evansella caseinilytica]